jgi:type II secretory pathway pseudopilin PulG
MRKTIHKKNSGFTLIELLLFMGIFSILIVVLLQLFVSIFDVQLESQATSAVASDGRFIINKLTNDIKNATGVTIPATAGASMQTLVISNGIPTLTYKLTNNNLTVTDSSLGSTDQLNSTNSAVTAINFLRLSDTKGQNANTITVTFTLNSTTKKRSGVSGEDFTFTVGTR